MLKIIEIHTYTLSPPLFYPPRSEYPAPFHLMWPRINKQQILDSVCNRSIEKAVHNLETRELCLFQIEVHQTFKVLNPNWDLVPFLGSYTK